MTMGPVSPEHIFQTVFAESIEILHTAVRHNTIARVHSMSHLSTLFIVFEEHLQRHVLGRIFTFFFFFFFC
jgi:hypothetical protein